MSTFPNAMNYVKGKLLYSFGVYVVSNALNAAIPFLLLPLLTGYLNPSDYGVLTNFGAIVSLLLPIIGLNLMTSLQVVYVKHERVLGSYISTGLIFMLMLVIAFTCVMAIFRHQLESLTGIPSSLLLLAAAYAAYQNVVEVLLSLWRMEDAVFSYGFMRVSRTMLEIGITIVLVVFLGRSYDGCILGMACSYGAAALVALVILFRKRLLILEFNKVHLSEIYRYGLPLVPHVLGSTAILYTDKLVITQHEGLAANGIYSVGFMVGQFIGLLQNSFNQVWVPFVYKALRTEDGKQKSKIVRFTYLYFIGFLCLSLMFAALSPLIFDILGESFQDGIKLVFWIALGFAFNGMYKMVSVYFFYLERTLFIGIITLVTALINLGLVLYMVPVYGIEGAAIASMFAFFIQFALTWIWSLRIIDMPWRKWRVWRD
jgi:O-antigen/teichoic acid export membrane protein